MGVLVELPLSPQRAEIVKRQNANRGPVVGYPGPGWRQSRESTAELPTSAGGLGFRGRLRCYGPLLFVLIAGGAMLTRPVDPQTIREEGFIQDNAILGMGGISLGGLDQASTGVPILTPTPEAASTEDLKRLAIIRQRMEEQLKSGQPSMFSTTSGMEWTVMIPEVVVSSVKIVDSKGIIRTDFPDQVTGREDLTGGPGSGPTIKGWQWGKSYDLETPPALGVQKLESGEEVYWLMYPTSEGGWGDVKQPHIESARIYSYDSRRSPRGIPRAYLFDKKGKEVFVDLLMLRPLAQFTLRGKDNVK